MFTIKKATTNDIQLINEMAQYRVSGYLPGNSFKRTIGLHDGLDVLSEKPA